MISVEMGMMGLERTELSLLRLTCGAGNSRAGPIEGDRMSISLGEEGSDSASSACSVGRTEVG